jgi:hypothetical protein
MLCGNVRDSGVVRRDANLTFPQWFRDYRISIAFYPIDMAPESQKYIGFKWLGKFYHYNSLPMGIHSAPFIFTEVTKPIIRAWRSKGILVLKYLDDFPSGAFSFLLQRLHCHYMVEHMRSLSWVLKKAKLLGYPDPLPELPALGIIVSFSAQQFRLKPAHAEPSCSPGLPPSLPSQGSLSYFSPVLLASLYPAHIDWGPLRVCAQELFMPTLKTASSPMKSCRSTLPVA